MELLTIITPAYNRAGRLPRLYQSLLEQTCRDFVWMVVDDGSTDETETVVRAMQEEQKIKLTYYKKKNGGKHTAVNLGIREMDSVLCMIVDSDDCLTEDAVEQIQAGWKICRNYKGICGMCFLKKEKNGQIMVSVGQEMRVENYCRCRIRENRPGDMAEVFLTRVLKQYRFPEFAGEKFLSEDVLWIEIAQKYQTVYFDRVIYICEYLKGGLTENDKPVKFASPLGSMLRGKQLMRRACGLKVNVKGAIIYNCYRTEVEGKLPEKLKPGSGYERILVGLTKGLGAYYYKKWKREKKSS